MAPLAGVFAEIVGLSEPGARFFVALISAYPFAFVYRCLVVPLSSNLQNAYFTVCGAWIMYYAYGLSVWHSLVDIFAVYLVLRVCGGSLLSVCLTWIITMGHLLSEYTYQMYMSEVHPISWTIPHCVLVLKLIGLSYNLYDGQKQQYELSEEFKMLAVHKVPSLLDVLGFCYFYGSLLVGPQVSFTRYSAFTEGGLYDRHMTPSSIPAGMQRLIAGVLVAVLFSVLNQYFPMATVASDEFMEKPFLAKLFLMCVCGKVAFWKFVGVWLIAEGSCIVTGISYEGKDREGTVSWHALANIHVVEFETCITLQGVIDSFNRNTNKWMSWYVYKRLKFLGSKMLSWFLTLLFLGVWHGVWPGYYLCFSLEMIGIMAERTFTSFSKKLLGCSWYDMSLVVRVPLMLAAYCLKSLMLLYPLSVFILRTWENCYKFMSSMYFYCHFVMIGWLVLYYTILSRRRQRRHQRRKSSTVRKKL